MAPLALGAPQPRCPRQSAGGSGLLGRSWARHRLGSGPRAAPSPGHIPGMLAGTSEQGGGSASPQQLQHAQHGSPRDGSVGALPPSHGSALPWQPLKGSCTRQGSWWDVTLPSWTPQRQGRCWHTVQCAQRASTHPEQHPVHPMHHTEHPMQQRVHPGCYALHPRAPPSALCTASSSPSTLQCTQHPAVQLQPPCRGGLSVAVAGGRAGGPGHLAGAGWEQGARPTGQ